MNDLLANARREVTQKPRGQIEEETAFKWASYSVATYELFQSTRLHHWLRDSQHYYDEALEHAALADESGEVLRAVRVWVSRYVPPGVI
jgi:hypothetical protein